MATNKFLDQAGAARLVDKVRQTTAGSAERSQGNTVKLKNGKGADLGTAVDIENIYNSEMDGTLTTTAAFGNIPAGTPLSQLKAMTLTQLLDKAFIKEQQPNVTAPSAAISFKSGFANGGVYEVGATAPAATNFNTSFNRGSATLAPNAGKYRAGAATGSPVIKCGNSTTLPAKIALNGQSYTATYSYGAGDELKTSYGNKASVSPNPLPAGSVTSGSVTVYGSYLFYCNGAAATDAYVGDNGFPTSMAEVALPLKRWDTATFVVAFASEALTGVHAHFDIPASKKVTKVECFNNVSGKWDITLGTNDYEEVDTASKTVNGSAVAYKRIQTKGDLAGARQLRFTVANR